MAAMTVHLDVVSAEESLFSYDFDLISPDENQKLTDLIPDLTYDDNIRPTFAIKTKINKVSTIIEELNKV